jgi:hypothetical protein
MPRRFKPVIPKGRISITDIALQDRALCERIVEAHRATATLPAKKKAQLIEEIFFAISGAAASLQPHLTGRTYKFDALTLDILGASVLRAWKVAGLKPTIWETNTGRSDFVDFMHALTKAADLSSGRGTLVNNLKRGRKIEIT